MTAVIFRENPKPAPLPPIESVVVSCAHTPRDIIKFTRTALGLFVEINTTSQQPVAAAIISAQDWVIILPALQELMKQKVVE